MSHILHASLYKMSKFNWSLQESIKLIYFGQLHYLIPWEHIACQSQCSANAWEMLLLTVLSCWLWLVSYLKGYIHKAIFSLPCFCLIKISINHKEIRNNDFCDDTRCPDCIFFLFWEFIHLHQQLFVEDGLSIVLISFLSFTLLKKLFTQIQYFLVILLISFF